MKYANAENGVGVMQRKVNYLFSDYDLRGGLENQEQQMYDEIDSIEANRLLNTSWSYSQIWCIAISGAPCA